MIISLIMIMIMIMIISLIIFLLIMIMIISLIISKMHQFSNRKICKVKKQLEEELLNDNFVKRKGDI